MDDPSRGHGIPRLIGMVAATGGPQAFKVILGGLPREFAVPILVVQSMPDAFIEKFINHLAGVGPLPIMKVEDGQVPEPGKVYLTGTDRHLLIEESRLRLVEPKDQIFHPKDVLFRSMASEIGPGAVAVVLTGMGVDGAAGLKKVRDAGGYTIAQDEATSIVYGTPRFAAGLNAACETLPLQEIAPRLLGLAGLDASDRQIDTPRR